MRIHEDIPENDLKRSKSDIDLAQSVQAEQNKSFAFKYRSKSVRAHRRTKSNEQWSQTDFDQSDRIESQSQRKEQESNGQLNGQSNKKTDCGSNGPMIAINEKTNTEIIVQTSTALHPAYICSLLVLVGFNFAAFTSFFYSSSILCKYSVFNMITTTPFTVIIYSKFASKGAYGPYGTR